MSRAALRKDIDAAINHARWDWNYADAAQTVAGTGPCETMPLIWWRIRSLTELHCRVAEGDVAKLRTELSHQLLKGKAVYRDGHVVQPAFLLKHC